MPDNENDYAGYEPLCGLDDESDLDDAGPARPGQPQLARVSYVPDIDPALWDRLVVRIVNDPAFLSRIGEDTTEQATLAYAGRILNQALTYLSLVAEHPGVGFSPSPLVDIGWHAFLLYTRDYARFCWQIAGRFIHHVPSDQVGVHYGHGNVKRTVRALRASGRTVDDMLWITDTMSCTVRLLDEKMTHGCGPCEPVCHSVPDRSRP